jgi:hypothetical protein
LAVALCASVTFVYYKLDTNYAVPWYYFMLLNAVVLMHGEWDSGSGLAYNMKWRQDYIGNRTEWSGIDINDVRMHNNFLVPINKHVSEVSKKENVLAILLRYLITK